MAEFLRLSKVKKTRKQHVCFACLEKIEVGNAAYQWVSVDGGEISSTYLHEHCGDIVESICFSCHDCCDDGFDCGFLRESMLNDADCEGVKAYCKEKPRKGEDNEP